MRRTNITQLTAVLVVAFVVLGGWLVARRGQSGDPIAAQLEQSSSDVAMVETTAQLSLDGPAAPATLRPLDPRDTDGDESLAATSTSSRSPTTRPRSTTESTSTSTEDGSSSTTGTSAPVSTETSIGSGSTSSTTENVFYASCAEARAAGAAPISAGDPGYRPGLDRDNDGVACEDGDEVTETTGTAPTSTPVTDPVPSTATSLPTTTETQPPTSASTSTGPTEPVPSTATSTTASTPETTQPTEADN